MKFKSITSVLFLLMFLSGCFPTGGGDGELEVEESVAGDEEETAEVILGPGGASSFEAFKATVFPLVRSKSCANCHGLNQSPQFADPDPVKAYNNLVSTGKVNLSSPADSRIVAKIKVQLHNCWSGNCDSDAAEMLEQVQRWADMVKDQGPIEGEAKFLTSELKYPKNWVHAQTEYGLTIIDAEQEDPSVQHGRFKTKIGSGATNLKYIDTAFAIPNPLLDVPRELTLHVNELKGGNCETFDIGDINDPVNGPVRINEGEVHVSSGRRMGSNGQPVRDGYRPYRIMALGNLIRPDRRVEYAKRLLSGNYAQVNELFMNTQNPGNDDIFEPYTQEEGATFPIMLGPALAIRLFYTAPHFVRHEEIFDSNGNLKPAGNTYTDLWGEQKDIYELFRGGSFDANNDLIRRKIEQDTEVDRKMVGYYQLKRAITRSLPSSIATASSNEMYKVYKDNFREFFALTSEVKMRCRYQPSEADEFIHDGCNYYPVGTPQCRRNEYNKGKKTCYGEWAKINNWDWYVTNVQGDPLTYANARDKLTLDNNDNIVPASSSDISNGNFFERIDLYYYTVIDTSTILTGNDANNSTANFSVTQMRSNSPNTYSDDESFSALRTKAFNFYSGRAQTYNLDLTNLLKGVENAVSPDVELQAFTNTLHAEIQSRNCVNCHGVNQNPTFALRDPAQAMQVIKVNNLVNFINPASSFRTGEMVHNTGRDDANTVRSAFINAINRWKSQMDASVNGQDYGPMADSERIPGYANYKFNVREGEAGYYNVWLRSKKNGDLNEATVYYRMRDSKGTILQAKENITNDNGGVNAGSCIQHDFTSPDYRWDTRGRQAEISGINVFTGRRLRADNDEPLPIGDSRIYYYLTPGSYTLTLYEGTPGAGLDAIAVNRVFTGQSDLDRASTDTRFTDNDTEQLLEFQPDLIDRHSKHIHDYHRYVLKYDISNLLKLSQGSAFFEVEIKERFDSNAYEFRSPRINCPSCRSQGKSIHVKNIFLYINGQTAQTDKTFEKIDGYYGDNRVITYAPLVALKNGSINSDTYSFGFEDLSLSDYSKLSEIKPAGDLPEGPQMRKCKELSLFTNTVKPIIQNITVTLHGGNNGLDRHLNPNGNPGGRWPGPPEQRRTSLDVYMCKGCHTPQHPYFPMASYDFNNNLLCSQMLSRANFNDYYASQILKGIDTAGLHPKFSFLEEFFWADNNKTSYKIHDLGNDYMKGYIVKDTSTGYATKMINSGLEVFKAEDFGWTENTDYYSLSEADKAKARLIGQVKLPRFVNLPQVNSEQDNLNYYGGYFIERIHGNFDGGIRGESDEVGSNIEPQDKHMMSVTFNGVTSEQVDPEKFPINTNRRDGNVYAVYYNFNEQVYLNNPIGTMPPSFADGQGSSNMDVSWRYKKSGTGQDTKREPNIDFDGDGNAQHGYQKFKQEEARINQKAREAIYNWIKAEHEACQRANDC